MPQNNIEAIDSLLSRLDRPFTCEALFDHLPDIVYFIKDSEGRYLVVNNTLVARSGAGSKSRLIGRTAAEALPVPYGDSFTIQDRAVIQSGKPLLAQLEMHVYPSRDVGWCLTSKLPLKTSRGEIVGLVGVSHDLRLPDRSTVEYEHIVAAVSHASAHLNQPPAIQELAKIAKMSRYQLDRRMQRVFGLTTGQWLIKLRIEAARQMLLETNSSIASISIAVGYCDQAAFSRQFGRTTGMSPRLYRKSREMIDAG